MGRLQASEVELQTELREAGQDDRLRAQPRRVRGVHAGDRVDVQRVVEIQVHVVVMVRPNRTDLAQSADRAGSAARRTSSRARPDSPTRLRRSRQGAAERRRDERVGRGEGWRQSPGPAGSGSVPLTCTSIRGMVYEPSSLTCVVGCSCGSTVGGTHQAGNCHLRQLRANLARIQRSRAGVDASLQEDAVLRAARSRSAPHRSTSGPARRSCRANVTKLSVWPNFAGIDVVEPARSTWPPPPGSRESDRRRDAEVDRNPRR